MRLPSIVSASQLEAMKRLALRSPDGCLVEVGVFMGGSASVLYEVAQEQHRELHLFDTFSGTPFHVEGLDKHLIDKEFAAETTPDLIRTFLPEAHIHQGIYPATHPSDLRDVAFIHCDCDQYDSYRAVLDYMWPLVVLGGFILFDDYPYLAGAKKAVEETFLPTSLRQCGQRYYAEKQVYHSFDVRRAPVAINSTMKGNA